MPRPRGGTSRLRWSLLFRSNPPVLDNSGILETAAFCRCGGHGEGVRCAGGTIIQVSSAIPNVKKMLWAVTCEIKAAGRRPTRPGAEVLSVHSRGPHQSTHNRIFAQPLRNEYPTKTIISPFAYNQYYIFISYSKRDVIHTQSTVKYAS